LNDLIVFYFNSFTTQVIIKCHCLIPAAWEAEAGGWRPRPCNLEALQCPSLLHFNSDFCSLESA
uniref:Uncharacterized protein n=1 Tax=Spermophilus dauricus TaxID=99837 RepID=A0A8C9PUW6_SPEDA